MKTSPTRGLPPRISSAPDIAPFARALRLERADGAVAAGDGQLVVEDGSRRAAGFDDVSTRRNLMRSMRSPISISE